MEISSLKNTKRMLTITFVYCYTFMFRKQLGQIYVKIVFSRFLSPNYRPKQGEENPSTKNLDSCFQYILLHARNKHRNLSVDRHWLYRKIKNSKWQPSWKYFNIVDQFCSCFFLMTNQVNEQRIPSHANLLYNVDLLLYKVLCRYTKFPTQVNEE